MSSEIPGWCSATVWHDASMAVVHAPEYTRRLHEDVARALLAAEARGIERAAKVAEGHATEASKSQKDAFDRGNDVAGNMFWSGQTAALSIASAIRQLLEKQG